MLQHLYSSSEKYGLLTTVYFYCARVHKHSACVLFYDFFHCILFLIIGTSWLYTHMNGYYLYTILYSIALIPFVLHMKKKINIQKIQK